MGALSAFMRGVAGPGLISLSENMRRQQEQEAIRAAREKELDEQRRFQADQKEQDRQLREELATVRGGRSTGTGGGSGGGGGALDPAAARDAVIYRVMQSEQVSRPEAERLLGMSDTGKNEFTTAVEDESGGHAAPDVAKFKSLMSKIGTYYSEAGSRAKSNYDQLMKGEQTGFETASGRAAQASPSQAPALGQGVAVAGGKPLFNDGGDNQYTGTTGALTAAKVGTQRSQATENLAQAGNASASAKKHMADVAKLKGELGGDLKSQTPERLTTTLNAINGLIRTYDENSMDDASRAARAELQSMARQIANELKRKGLGGGAAPGPAVPGAPAPSRAGQFKVLR